LAPTLALIITFATSKVQPDKKVGTLFKRGSGILPCKQNRHEKYLSADEIFGRFFGSGYPLPMLASHFSLRGSPCQVLLITSMTDLWIQCLILC